MGFSAELAMNREASTESIGRPGAVDITRNIVITYTILEAVYLQPLPNHISTAV
jgi:hypothetical protein